MGKISDRITQVTGPTESPNATTYRMMNPSIQPPANATLYSSLLGQTVELPLDGAAYERKLQELITGSRLVKKVVAITGEDFTKSFVR